jgi:predicted N-acyltransferase
VTVSARIVSEFNTIDERDWERLDHADNPFLSHAFLGALESSGSIGPHLGWQPHHLALFESGQLAAFAPSYIKSNSHGEFVFDWAWADAYHRNGLSYYPKLLTAVPYTPVTGPRLLVRRGRDDAAEWRDRLVQFAIDECRKVPFSSWHCNFLPESTFRETRPVELLQRHDWQFHWRNRGYGSFDDFLDGLKSRKRKSIRRERQRVAQAGIRFEWKFGDEVTADDLDLVFECYTGTFHAYGNLPALNRAFFETLARALGERFRVATAVRDGEAVAMSLFFQGGGRLYGRYWGSLEDMPGLHFEAAYYQGIEHCIRHGIEVFESGAQGEHKIARGFMPARTRSLHYIREPAFRRAIGEFLGREHRWLSGYREELVRHDPYRQAAP